MAGDHPTILYVDDERPNRIVFEQTFVDRFPIRTVASGREALETLASASVAVLVTDQRMPDMTGNELLEITKRDYPEVVRVVITAYSDLDPILRAVNEGLVARYIVKPWDQEELARVLAWGLDAYRMGQNNTEAQLRLLETERLATLGSINAAVLHDINQPLAYLTTNTERLAQLALSLPALVQLNDAHGHEIGPRDRENLTDLAEELPEIIEDMFAGCRVMSSLTGSVRNLLHPPPENDQASSAPLTPIRFALAVCRQPALKARGQLHYEGPDDLPRVAIGATELIQVLVNVLSNAAQALERREQSGGRVVLAVTVEDRWLRMVVRDNGPGMSPQVLTKVGTPFFSTRTDGTGLGIHQCRRLVERIGGSFRIESVEGEGTDVTITVPRDPTAAAQAG